MRKTCLTLICTSLLSMAATAAFADDYATDNKASGNCGDKDQYNLFNPTPDNCLRDIAPRFRTTAWNATTLDAGHIQFEAADFIYQNSDRLFSIRHNQVLNSFAPTVSVGLLNNVDFHVTPAFSVISDTYRNSFGGMRWSKNHTTLNMDSVNLASTINLWGNDGGATAFGIMPVMQVPVTGGQWIGGVALPFSVNLPQQFTLSYVPGFYLTTQGATYGQFEHAVVLDEAFTDKVHGFINFTAIVTSRSSQDWWGYAGFGASYQLTRNIEAYASMRFGFEGAYDLAPYAGIAWRF